MTATTVRKDAAATARDDIGREPVKLQKRIGSATYIVNVRVSDSATETMEQKLLRIIEREVAYD